MNDLINFRNNRKMKNILALISLVILIFMGIKYIYAKNTGLIMDVSFSIIILIVFYFLYQKLHQDVISYFFLIFSLILHNLYLYPTSPLGIRFDHYMHFVSGFTIALITDRIFNEKIGKIKRFYLLIMVALGIGAIGEISEWLGYGILGYGDGFFLFGSGDEGEWRNCILDLIFDLFGGIGMGVITLFRKNKEGDKMGKGCCGTSSDLGQKNAAKQKAKELKKAKKAAALEAKKQM